ncbi:hypothetical protein [Trinickia fusca]|uniref:Glycosaminoglycan attachment site n=1 Tax=Trinickia fusca TaxID=2419777 RepID=A0A494WZM0_9BURK|nr:hypothetical protein [Trinickia fusca]RKP43482.1 hypothetical protein D7S89_25915 [Trinickia fusca]
MQEIARIRFEALAAYCRQPEAMLFGEEVHWFQAHEEAVLVVIVRDRADGDYSAVLLAKDLKERYRWVGMTGFFEALEASIAAASEEVSQIYAHLEEERAQGDERGRPVDFFAPVVVPEKLNRDFATISSSEGYSPAVDLIKPMMRWYEDADGNFIEQFQTTGFDARLWELYLFATLVEAGNTFDKAFPMPDFCARSVVGELCVEATTVNPSRNEKGELVPPPLQDTEEQIQVFQRQYMPIRYAGPLTTKLAKRYWEKEYVQGRPLAFAIQDFHAPMSMLMSRTALPIYLYGTVWDWAKGADGGLVITPTKISTHVWGRKEIASGFFSQPGAENVSAVIANASATISKFNRMGVLAGFGSKRVRLVREGTAANPDSNSEMPQRFAHEVNSPQYTETWIEGMDVYHNPNSKIPLDPAMLPGAAHHWLREDGQLESWVPKWQPFSSVTRIFVEAE